jgi:hypothetical protein
VHVDYDAIAVEIDDWSTVRYGFFPANMRSSRRGEPVFWYRRFADVDLAVFYTLANGGGIDESLGHVADTVKRLGGRVGRVEAQRRWRYFPHVAAEDMRAGFYERFESMQGAQRTWWTGELFSFATVETVVAHARALVDNRFA